MCIVSANCARQPVTKTFTWGVFCAVTSPWFGSDADVRTSPTDDATRVLLTAADSGDYINANFVNMEIPGSGIVNRYIAAQGECLILPITSLLTPPIRSPGRDGLLRVTGGRR